MINQIDNPQTTTHNKRTITGIILLGIGAIMLLSQANAFTFPVWAITWPLGLIGYGLYTGFKHNFKKSMWIIYTMVGVIFLLPNIIPALSINLLWPLLIIAFGIKMLTRRNQYWKGDHWVLRDGNKYHGTDNIE